MDENVNTSGIRVLDIYLSSYLRIVNESCGENGMIGELEWK
jgi:hypothetical protein